MTKDFTKGLTIEAYSNSNYYSDLELLKELSWERECISATYDKFREAWTKRGAQHTAMETPLLELMCRPLESQWIAEQDRLFDLMAQGVSAGRQKHHPLLLALDAEVGAFLVVTSVIRHVSFTNETCTDFRILNWLTSAFKTQFGSQRLLADDPEWSPAAGRARAVLADRRPDSISRWIKAHHQRLDEALDDPDSKALLALADFALQLLVSQNPDVFTVTRRVNKPSVVRYTDEFQALGEELMAELAETFPTLMPMLVKPQAWHWVNGRLRGGYLGIDRPLFNQNHGLDHDLKPSTEALAAINVLQQTSWSVNTRALAFMNELIASGNEAVPQPRKWDSLGARLTDEDWDALSKQERDDHIFHKRREIEVRTRHRAHVGSLWRVTSLASRMVSEGNVFYFPHLFDFRGRAYPSSAHLHPQADKWAKGLLQFTNAKRLGPEGLAALKHHVANCYGFDKASIAERIQWTDSHLETFQRFCRYPSLELQWFGEADSPLCFLTAVWELVDAYELDNPEDYLSHIPVSVDGTCNGMQVLSLLGKDAVGARATNCTSDPKRHDIYGLVASSVLDTIRGLANEPGLDGDAARFWRPIMEERGRSVVKRTVMTTPYGVTRRGVQDHLIGDGWLRGHPLPAWEGASKFKTELTLANYMASWVDAAQRQVVSSAMTLMEFIQNVTWLLCDENRHLSWTTPDGCQVTQGYVRFRSRSVSLVNEAQRLLRFRTTTVDRSKAVNASSPNVVHSLDATLMRRVALRLASAGIPDMVMVHDSFGVHAADLETLNRAIREEAVEMFSGDFLADFIQEQRTRHPDIKFPDAPAQGDLDVVTELMNAEFFFS